MPKSSHIKVLVVRSGANDWDQSGRLSGSADLPLTAEGRAAVHRFAAELEPRSVARLLSGPEEATEETAEIIAAAAGVRSRVVPVLHEIGLGRWEGMTAQDAEARYASVFRQWREDPTSIEPPGGERVNDAAERMLPAVRDVLSRCKADDSCGVGFVLRPMAFGVVRCWLRGEELSGLWRAVETEECAEWFLVDRSSLRGEFGTAPWVVRDAG